MRLTDLTLTLLVPAVVLLLIIFNSRKGLAQNALSINASSTLKAISCIVVIMVHFKEGHQNFAQDAIGSFAYVAVTIFFLLSGYGMTYSIEHKTDYLKHFWRDRFSSIIIPAIIAKIVAFFTLWTCSGIADYRNLLTANTFVLVLCQFYVLFYFIHKLTFLSRNTKNYILIGIVTVSSIISYIYSLDNGSTSIAFGWPWERMGLAWGIILYMLKNKVYTAFSKFNKLHCILLFAIGLILGLSYLKYKTVFMLGGYILKLMLGIALICIALLYLSNRDTTSKIISFLASISYEIYLIHEISMQAIDLILPKIPSGYFIVLTYAVTFILAYIIHFISNPIIKLIRTKQDKLS
ncbi:MAG: acyltransferase [Muribaculaceae bacterium]|nr:acyltransferase [Muribaculaceae bacterium]